MRKVWLVGCLSFAVAGCAIQELAFPLVIGGYCTYDYVKRKRRAREEERRAKEAEDAVKDRGVERLAAKERERLAQEKNLSAALDAAQDSLTRAKEMGIDVAIYSSPLERAQAKLRSPESTPGSMEAARRDAESVARELRATVKAAATATTSIDSATAMMEKVQQLGLESDRYEVQLAKARDAFTSGEYSQAKDTADGLMSKIEVAAKCARAVVNPDEVSAAVRALQAQHFAQLRRFALSWPDEHGGEVETVVFQRRDGKPVLCVRGTVAPFVSAIGRLSVLMTATVDESAAIREAAILLFNNRVRKIVQQLTQILVNAHSVQGLDINVGVKEPFCHYSLSLRTCRAYVAKKITRDQLLRECKIIAGDELVKP